MGTANESTSTSRPAAVPSDRARILEDGVLTGTLGAAVVAVWFLALDFARGVPLFTPSLLGSVVFRGRAVEEVTTVDTAMVFAYTGLHAILFLMVGVMLAWMFSQFERNAFFGTLLLLLFFVFEAILLGLEVTIVPDLVGALGTWAVGLANLLSAIAMFAFLIRRRPAAFSRLRAGWKD